MSWIREGLTLHNFSNFVEVEKLRLSPTQSVDAFIRFTSCEVPVEITEVMEPGRRRGLEYRKGAPKVTSDPVEDWVERAESIQPALTSAVRTKSTKDYPKNTRLIIYLNISEWGIRQSEIEKQIQSIILQPSKFAAIYVLWKEKLLSSEGEIKTISKN